jgi:hypothetical protein
VPVSRREVRHCASRAGIELDATAEGRIAAWMSVTADCLAALPAAPAGNGGAAGVGAMGMPLATDTAGEGSPMMLAAIAPLTRQGWLRVVADRGADRAADHGAGHGAGHGGDQSADHVADRNSSTHDGAQPRRPGP